MSRRLPVPPVFAGFLAASLALAGCSEADKFAPECPQLALLAEGADLTRFAGTGRDVTDRILEARVVAVGASCKPGRRNTVVATLKVQTEITRGPAATTRAAQLPYFIAVLADGQIIERREFVLGTSFAANVDALQVTGDEIELRFPITAQRSAAAYKIYVSLVLTPEELAYNRRPGR